MPKELTPNLVDEFKDKIAALQEYMESYIVKDEESHEAAHYNKALVLLCEALGELEKVTEGPY